MASQKISGFYDGFRILEPIGKWLGLPIDQVNFLACQLFSIGFGYFYRTKFSHSNRSVLFRHVLQVVVGLLLIYFCFGRQITHLLAQSSSCYLLMKLLPPGMMERVVFVAALGYLCLCHIYRQIYDYGGYTLDITGPLMVNTQRLSSLAFSLCDGMKKEEKLSPMMKEKAIKKLPTPLPFLSYMFSFHGVMCGPFCFYKDYESFIDGSAFKLHKSEVAEITENHNVEPNPIPSPRYAVIEKLTATIVCGSLSIVFLPRFPVSWVLEEGFKSSGFISKIIYLIICTSLMRAKYYFGWKISEAANVSSGLGFNGYDEKGRSKWNLADNADIYKVETCNSLKVLLDNWNITTALWLRYTVYERIHSSFLVFLFSAFWHGFYVGYYITFITGGMCIQAARMVRRNIRPFFQGSSSMAFLYDCITFVAARCTLAYSVFPFVLMELRPAFYTYREIYFVFHILSLSAIIFFTVKPLQRQSKKQQ